MSTLRETAALQQPSLGRSMLSRWWFAFTRFMRTKPLGGTGVVILTLTLIIAVGAPVLATEDPSDNNYLAILEPPGPEHLFGTDVFGRDILSRTLYGTRISLIVGVLTMLIATTIGAVLGVSSAYFGGKYDLILQRFVDAMTFMPSLLFALTLMAIFEPGFTSLMIAMVVIFSSRGIRIIRSQALSIKEMPYVDAARASGAASTRIMLRHILPNTFGPMMVVATTMVGSAIVIEASLSFLGIGMPSEIISWGGMLSGEMLRNFTHAPWIGIFPGFALTFLVFGVNVLGDAFRDVFDPRLRGR
jgi:peptide/nickel transport system permease protein